MINTVHDIVLFVLYCVCNVCILMYSNLMSI